MDKENLSAFPVGNKNDAYAKYSVFQHLAIEVPAENGRTEWCEPVSDEEYYKLDR